LFGYRSESRHLSDVVYVLGWTQWTIGNGARSSSAVSYLGPGYIKRPNLAVLLHARVLRIGQTKSSSNNVAFREVQFTQDAGGNDHKYLRSPLLIHCPASIHNLTASKEVILSAGSIMTPTILLHSGIGNSTELRAVGITPLHELPSVGKNLTVSTHPCIIYQNIHSNATILGPPPSH
jgi:choline dehydrogenase-like flavoprotein